MSRRERTSQGIEAEIRGEKAAALGRAGERLESALDEARTVAARLDAARDPVTRARLLHEYEAVRQRAQMARFALLIQREAMGLRHHALVDQVFPEPPRRR